VRELGRAMWWVSIATHGRVWCRCGDVVDGFGNCGSGGETCDYEIWMRPDGLWEIETYAKANARKIHGSTHSTLDDCLATLPDSVLESAAATLIPLRERLGIR